MLVYWRVKSIRAPPFRYMLLSHVSELSYAIDRYDMFAINPMKCGTNQLRSMNLNDNSHETNLSEVPSGNLTYSYGK